MSQASLLYAVKKFFIDNLTFNNTPITEGECDVMVDGRPPGACGELFISVHPGGFRGSSMEILHAIHQINVTVTLRVAKIPFDRMGVLAVTDEVIGLSPLVQTIIEYVHLNYDILAIADSLLPNTINKWVEPLRFQNAAPPRLVGSEWFHGESGREEAIIQTIAFGDAVRVQFGTFQSAPNDVRNIKIPGIVE